MVGTRSTRRGRNQTNANTNVNTNATSKGKGKSESINEVYSPLPVYKLTRPIIDEYAIKHTQCNEIDGKYYFVHLNPYESSLLQEKLPVIEDVEKLKDANDGIYTYVVLSLDDGPVKIYLIRVLNIYEFGTKHQQLVHRIACINNKCKKYNLFYAGEVLKEGDVVRFNFYSGTFKMETKLKKKNTSKDINYVKRFLDRSGINVEFVNEPLIIPENLQLTKQDIDLYKSIGANVFEFDNKDKCDTFIGTYFVKPSLKLSEKVLSRRAVENGARVYGGKYGRKSRRLKNGGRRKTRHRK